MEMLSQEAVRVLEQPALGTGERTITPQVLVIGGGKGGVGKTCFAVNTAVEVARPPSAVIWF